MVIFHSYVKFPGGIGLNMYTHTHTHLFGGTWYAKFADKPVASYVWTGSTVQQTELPPLRRLFLGHLGPGGPKAGAVCKQE